MESPHDRPRRGPGCVPRQVAYNQRSVTRAASSISSKNPSQQSPR
jgi:hypothetical protein